MSEAMTQDRTPLMALEGVSQTFKSKKGDIPAVDDVDLNIYPSEVLCVVGESGCGKTTSARMAAGLAKPTGGVVAFKGQDIWAMDKDTRLDFRRKVQYIHQDPYASLNPLKSIYDTLTAPLRKHGIVKTKQQAYEKACELLERVHLTPAESYISKFPHQLSGGQRQRVAVARALTLSPELIIADESTSMLDVSIRVGMLNMLGQLRDDLGVGFMFITHDLAVAKYFGWRGKTAVMYLGRVVEFGPTPEVINNPQHPYTKALLDAVPEPDPELTALKLPGGGLRSSEIPSLRDLPSGCTFHPRCPLFEEGTCDVSAPSLSVVSPSHSVSCHVVARAASEGVPARELQPTARLDSGEPMGVPGRDGYR